MQNLKCKYADHDYKQIQAACLFKNCPSKRLCCLKCIIQFHFGHNDQLLEVEEISLFAQEARNEPIKFPKSYCYAQIQIIKRLEQLCDLIENFHRIVKSRLNEIRGQNLQEYLKTRDDKQKGTQYWEEFIQELLKYIYADKGSLKRKNQQEDSLSEMEKKSIQILKESVQKQQDLIQFFNVPSYIKQLKFSNNPSLLQGHKKSVAQAIISQDGSIIVSGSEDKTVKLWDTHSKQVIKVINNNSEVQNVALSFDNKYFAFSDLNNEIHCFDLKQNEYLWEITESRDLIRNIIFSQDAQYLLFGGEDSQLIIWNVIQNIMVHQFKVEQAIEAIVISPCNKLISCLLGPGGTIIIWDFQTKCKLIHQDQSHHYGYGLCSSADSSIYISCGTEGIIKLWHHLTQSLNAQNSLTLTAIIEDYDSGIESILLTKDEQYIISISNEEGKIKVHERESRKLVQVLDFGESSLQSAGISISNDMNILVSTNYTLNIKIWTLNDI